MEDDLFGRLDFTIAKRLRFTELSRESSSNDEMGCCSK